MRVQYGSQIEGLLVEYYDKDYNITDTKMIQQELPIFGGFYATDSNYYVVTGQKNTEENNNVEVYRITKYDKQWNRVNTASLKELIRQLLLMQDHVGWICQENIY